MTLYLKRLRMWLSPSARHGRQVARDYATWAEAQRDMHSRAGNTTRHKQ
jgi:hypothetical protein